MPSLFDDFKKEFGKHAEVFSEKMNELSETAKDQFEIINLKKDRYLKLKELGDRVFQMSKENKFNIKNDTHVKKLIAAIKSLNGKIGKLDKSNS